MKYKIIKLFFIIYNKIFTNFTENIINIIIKNIRRINSSIYKLIFSIILINL